MIHQYFISITCTCLGILYEIHTPICFFQQWFSVILRCNKRETCVICLLIVSGKSSTNAIGATFSQTITHWSLLIFHTHSAHCPRKDYANYAKKIRKTGQYCANFYAKPNFELLKTWNRVKHRYDEHRRTTAEVPRQKNWWNAQIADVSRKTRNLCAIHVFTWILGSVTGP